LGKGEILHSQDPFLGYAMNPIDEITQGTFEDVINKALVPEYPCRKCGIHFNYEPDDLCLWCIDELINDKGDE